MDKIERQTEKMQIDYKLKTFSFFLLAVHPYRRPWSAQWAQVVPPITTHFCVAWSVCLSHSCTLLKPFDWFRCHLAGTLVGSRDTLCQMGVPDPVGKGRFGRTAHPSTFANYCCHLANRKEAFGLVLVECLTAEIRPLSLWHRPTLFHALQVAFDTAYFIIVAFSEFLFAVLAFVCDDAWAHGLYCGHVVRWRKRMQQSITDQEKSADENSFVCNGRLVCCRSFQSHNLLCIQVLLYSQLFTFTMFIFMFTVFILVYVWMYCWVESEHGLRSVCLSHLCPLLKSFNGFWCHLATALVLSNDTLQVAFNTAYLIIVAFRDISLF